MPNLTRWSIPNRFFAGALILYSALLCAVSLHVFYSAVHQGSPLNAAAITIQSLTTLFLPMLILGLWKPRLASGLLFAGVAAILLLTFSTSHSTTNGMAGLVEANLLFLGVPMLGSAIFFHRISRPATAPSL